MDSGNPVLVTGANGFIGRHLLDFLSEKPEVKVWAIDRVGSIQAGVQIEPVDLTSMDILRSWLKGKPKFQTVYHLASLIPLSAADLADENVFNANVSMMRNVISIVEADRASLVYTSSIAIYGRSSSVPITEDWLPQPANLYAVSKYVGEMLAEITHQQHGLKTVSLRLAAPYGPHQKNRTVINIFLQALRESRNLVLYGSGSRSQDFVYVGDIIQALWKSGQMDHSGVYNIGSGRSVTMRELAENVLLVAPDSHSQIEYAGLPDPQENYRGEFSIDKARRELEYSPDTALLEGLRVCYETFTSNVA